MNDFKLRFHYKELSRNRLITGGLCKIVTCILMMTNYKMRKRTFEERMNDVQTGKWSKFSDIELKGM